MPVSVFDAYGTLLDVHSAVLRHAGTIGPEAARLADLWRTKQLEYTWVLNGIGRYAPFDALTEQALHHAADVVGGVPKEMRETLLGAYADLEPYDDAGPALERLKSAGHDVVVFSNANGAMLSRALASACLDRLVDHVVSVDRIETFKPDPRTYALLDRWRANDLTFHSSNRWDVAGAVAAGLDAIWVNRCRAPDEYGAFAPVATVASLAEAIGDPPPRSPSWGLFIERARPRSPAGLRGQDRRMGTFDTG